MKVWQRVQERCTVLMRAGAAEAEHSDTRLRLLGVFRAGAQDHPLNARNCGAAQAGKLRREARFVVLGLQLVQWKSHLCRLLGCRR